MATKPTVYPSWATEDDEVGGTPNKVKPSSAKQLYGQRSGEDTTRQDINYLFNLTDEWIQHLDGRCAVGDIVIRNADETPSTVSAQMGGTWVQIGSDTVAGITMWFYRKTV